MQPSVAQPAVVIVQPPDQTRLAFLGRFFPFPSFDDLVGPFVIKTAIRASVQCDEQIRTSLFCMDERKQVSDRPDQLFALFPLPEQRVGRKQYGVEFAAQHIAVYLQSAVLSDRFGRQGAIFVRRASRGEAAPHSLVQAFLQPVVIQPGIYVFSALVQSDDLVLSRTNVQQRNPHPVLYAYDDIFPVLRRVGSLRVPQHP